MTKDCPRHPDCVLLANHYGICARESDPCIKNSQCKLKEGHQGLCRYSQVTGEMLGLESIPTGEVAGYLATKNALGEPITDGGTRARVEEAWGPKALHRFYTYMLADGNDNERGQAALALDRLEKGRLKAEALEAVRRAESLGYRPATSIAAQYLRDNYPGAPAVAGYRDRVEQLTGLLEEAYRAGKDSK